MKKFLLALILTVSGTAMAAGTATVEYSNVQGLDGKPGGQGSLIKWTMPMTKGIDWDFQMTNSQTDITNAVSTRAEIGLVPRYDLGWARFSTKVAVGNRLNSRGDFAYYSIEPALTVPLNNQFSVRAGYRFREAFDGAVADTTKTARLGVTYNFTKRDAFTVRFDRQRGDSDQNSWNFAYTRRF